MAANVVWGVDIGNSAIKAVKMIRVGDEATVVEFDIIDIVGAEDDESDRQAQVSKSLGTLVENHDFGKDPVYISLPGNLCLFREFQLPPGSESKLAELVQYEAKQQIPFPLDQVELVWERFDDPSGTGVGVEMIVVRKNIIEEILALTDQANLNVEGISVAPVALFNFINYEYSPSGATLILDAGHKSTDFVVVRDRHMYSRTIHIAGRELTRVLENKFKVPFEKAEELKRNIGQSKQAKKILSVIEPTLRQLGSEIQRTIGFYKSKARGQKLTQGYLLGHTFRLPGMAETMAGNIREASFTIVEGIQRIRLDRSINPDVFANEFPTMAVTIGLGLQGLELSEWKANLLPKERVVTQQIEGKRGWGIACAAAVLLTVLATYNLASGELNRMNQLKEQIDSAGANVRKYEKDLKRAVQGLSYRKERLERISRIGRDRGRMTQIFNRMTSLKDGGGQSLFGPAQKTFLANVYVSRTPLTYKSSDGWAPVKEEFNNSRKANLNSSQYLEGAGSVYSELAEAGDLKDLPEENRPDVPLVVILSLECEGNRAQVVQNVESALKKISEVDGTSIKYETPAPRQRREKRPNMDKAGNPLTSNPVHGSDTVRTFYPLHFIFKWSPKDVPDAKLVKAEEAPKKSKKSKG